MFSETFDVDEAARRIVGLDAVLFTETYPDDLAVLARRLDLPLEVRRERTLRLHDRRHRPTRCDAVLPMLADEFDLVERVARRLGRDPGPILGADRRPESRRRADGATLSAGGRRRPGPSGCGRPGGRPAPRPPARAARPGRPRRSRSAPASSSTNSCSRSGPSVRLWSSALRAGNVEPLMPSTSAAWASLPAPEPVEAQHPAVVAVQAGRDLQRMATGRRACGGAPRWRPPGRPCRWRR